MHCLGAMLQAHGRRPRGAGGSETPRPPLQVATAAAAAASDSWGQMLPSHKVATCPSRRPACRPSRLPQPVPPARRPPPARGGGATSHAPCTPPAATRRGSSRQVWFGGASWPPSALSGSVEVCLLHAGHVRQAAPAWRPAIHDRGPLPPRRPSSAARHTLQGICMAMSRHQDASRPPPPVAVRPDGYSRVEVTYGRRRQPGGLPYVTDLSHRTCDAPAA